MDLPMTVPRSGPAPAGWVPVEACTLPTAVQPMRVAEWDDLFRACLTAVERSPGAATRARLVLTGGEGLHERVQRLADAETACCSFSSFTVTALPAADGCTVALDVEVPAVHAAVLDGLLDRAEQVGGGAA